MFRSSRFSRILFLLTALMLFGQATSAQFFGQKRAPTSYIETERVAADAFDLPMRIHPDLSGGFAELRVNHLHSGIDFKTQKAQGFPIYAPADGWVSRIRISAFGFGYALYIDHENGFTTVYGHLQQYADPIATIARNMQYRRESFELDTLLPIRRIPVRKGQLIAWSGSSGLSAAPHLHFEIRDTPTEETIDPLLWYSDRIKDSLPPRIYKLALFALEGEGALSNGSRKAFVPVVKNQQGEWVISGKLPTAWGKIGLGLNAYDYMDGNANQYGICSIRLFQGEELIFQQDLSRFNFNQTRYVNSLADYESWKRNRTWIMKSFLDPGNNLNVYPTLKDRGIVTINSEKTYTFRYELMDRAGNSTAFRFSVQGKKSVLPKKVFTGKKMIFWVPNYYSNRDFKLEIPSGTLYRTLDFQFRQQAVAGFSDLFLVHNSDVPLHQPIQARFRIRNDILPDKKQYYLAKVDAKGQATHVNAFYDNGWMESDLKEFGAYKVLSDTVIPKITVTNLENIAKNSLIRIRIVDNASGVECWRGTIDGKWALFALDGKSGWLSCALDSTRVNPRREHTLRLSVRDACGNENRWESTFYW
jgi:hypothetical protein